MSRNYTAGELNPWAEVVTLEDHLEQVAVYAKEMGSLKAEIDKLVSSLESWDEEFK